MKEKNVTRTSDRTAPVQGRLRLRFVLIAITLAVATVIAPAATATAQTTGPSAEQAAGAAYNTRELWLRYPAPAGAEYCESREIYLAADQYLWGQIHLDRYGSSRIIDLAAGWYVWKDCIGAYGDDYYHDTYLRQKATGGYAHLDRTSFGSRSGTFWDDFGSYLTQH